MNVDITKEEYRTLLDMLQMAEWVMHSNKTEEDPREAPYEKLIQKFYGLAKDMGQEKLIEYSPGLKRYSPTLLFEDTSEAWDFIDDFTDDMFWDELIHRLTDRDLGRAYGGYEQLDNMGMEERFKVEGPVLGHYGKEFDEHGLDRLEIVEHFGQTFVKPGTTSD